MARAALIELADQNDDIVPLIWQMSEPASPGAEDRFQYFAGETLPYGIFGGNLSFSGEDEAMSYYTVFYEQLTGAETPWVLEVEFEFDQEDNILINAHISLEESVNTDTVIVLFALTQHDLTNYSSLVLQSSFEDSLIITQAGESETISRIFVNDDYYDLTSLRAVVLIQNSATREVVQACQTPVTQLIPALEVNLNSGPASLGIHFQNISFPIGQLVSWQWDFQNDGSIDSSEENPYWVYDEPGVYDLRLVISDGEETVDSVFTELITVQETDQIEGTVLGVWRPEYNPYVIIDDVSIPYYGELVIEAGTEIQIEYENRINVYGRIEIAGTESEPVILTSESSWKGIKLLNSQEDNRIEHAHITNTSLSAINASYSSIVILDNHIYNNSSGSLGSGINLLGCDDAVITGNFIVNNSSSMTGGIALRSSHPVIANNIIANNQGSMAGAVVIREGSEPILINNVIANNEAPVAAIFVDESTPEFINNILIDDEAVFLADLDDLRISYTISSQYIPGDTNINADPLFIFPTLGSGIEYDALQADWTLQPGSQAIDAGNPDPEFNDIEDPSNPGFALYPSLGTILNDIGAYGGPYVIPQIVSNHDDDIPASSFRFFAYPNPFNPQTTISYELNEPGIVELSVFNIKGQKVTDLLEQHQEAGIHNIIWKADQLASGIYFIKINSPTLNKFKKVILMK